MYINFLNHRLLGQTDDVLFMSLKFLGRNDIGEFGTNGRLGHQDTRGKTKAAPIWEAGLENRRQQQNKLQRMTSSVQAPGLGTQLIREKCFSRDIRWCHQRPSKFPRPAPRAEFSKFWTGKEKVTGQWKRAMLDGHGEHRRHSAAWELEDG